MYPIGSKDWLPIIFFGGVGIAVLAFYCWWYLPKKLVKQFSLSGKEKAEVEDYYRKAIGQGIGGSGLIISLIFSWQQYSANLALATKTQQLEQYEKQFSLLGGENMAVRVGAVFGLEQLTKSEPSWSDSIVSALAIFAVNYSKINRKKGDRVGSDAESALQVVGRSKRVNAIRLQLDGGLFQGARLDRMDFNYAHLAQTTFNGSDLYSSSFYESNLFEAQMKGVGASSAKFPHSNLQRIIACPGRNLSIPAQMNGMRVHTNFTSAEFFSADLRDSWLLGILAAGAKFQNSRMNGVKLNFANVFEADFTNADLSNADFTDADARKAKFYYRDYGEDSKNVHPESMLTGTKFNRADLYKSEFYGLSVSSASFIEANLEDVTFDNVDKNESYSERWRGARFCKTKFRDGVRNDGCNFPWSKKVDPPVVAQFPSNAPHTCTG